MTTESELQQARDERDAAIDRAKMAEEALGILLDDSTIATDAPDAEWQCRFCAGIDGHHVPPCAVQRVIHLLLPPVAPPAPVPPGETRPACNIPLRDHVPLAAGFRWVSHSSEGCGCEHPSGEGAMWLDALHVVKRYFAAPAAHPETSDATTKEEP